MNNKKYRKYITLPILLIVLGISVAGALVAVLSNRAEIDINVEPPFLVEIDNPNIDVYGGETAEVEVTTTNRADTTIRARPFYRLSNEAGLTTADFTLKVDGLDWDASLWSFINSTMLQINKPWWHNWTAEEEKTEVFEFRFVPNAVGNYHLITEMLV